ncbi:hypothetical protein BVC80_9095g128 [Macleaya cordata]|uniref:AAA+ ATPase domain n=1 Tax=Macleaya cordata TaxID=56857 RepID=A0A200PXN0_MACCD|nr:hypothetical protein BVC80_9095g128 [Macleaya cordata]
MPITTDPNSFSATTTTTTTDSQLPPRPTTRRKQHETRTWKSTGSKNSDLTEENLEEFKRRTGYSKGKIIKNYASTSPYYRGLTDSSLFITRQKGSSTSIALTNSPGKESSHESAGTSASSSISTVFVKIKELGSYCFKRKNGDSSSKVNAAASSSSSSSSSTTVTKNVLKKLEVALMKKTEMNASSVINKEENPLKKINKEEKPLMNNEKSLKERITAGSAGSSGGSAEAVLVREREVVVREKKPLMKESRKYVWADQYRPKDLKDFICNRDKAEYLHNLVKEKGQCSHYIFEGPAGVGKTTMIWAFLREAFGLRNFVVIHETRLKPLFIHPQVVPSIEVDVKVSSHHVELNLSELGGYEKHVIVALIKETETMMKNQARQCDHTNCYAIIIHEADKLSRDAQHYIRWLMERNKSCNKIFFCCTEISKLQHIRSICTVIQLLPPSNKEIVEVLELIAEREGIQLPHQLAERIADNSKHNLRQAIRSFEASWQSNHKFNEDQVIMTGWEEDVANIAENIIEEQSPKQLYIIRGKLQNLIDHNVSPDFIFSSLVGELKTRVSDEVHPKIDAFYLEYKMNSGGIFDGEKSLVLLHSRYKESRGKRNNDLSKDVQHFMMIEEFTAKFMTFYKAYMKKKKNIERANGF